MCLMLAFTANMSSRFSTGSNDLASIVAIDLSAASSSPLGLPRLSYIACRWFLFLSCILSIMECRSVNVGESSLR